MGNAFLHGQSGGGGGAKLAAGTFTAAGTSTETIQLSSKFIPDHIRINMKTYAGTWTSSGLVYMYYILEMNYDKSTGSWTILYKLPTASGRCVFYEESAFTSDSSYGCSITYNKNAATIALSANGSNPPFYKDTIFEWVMWQDQ